MNWLWPSAAAVAALAALSPTLYGLGVRMWGDQHREFFPFVLIGAAFLAWYKLRPAAAAPADRPNRFLAAGLWTIAWLVTAVSVAASGNWLGGVALLAVLPAWVYSLGGAAAVRHLAGVWLFLLLALPLPFGGDTWLVTTLQRVASAAAAGVLDLFGYVHIPRGVTITVAGYDRPFFVDEACSGVNSLFSALCCVGFYLVLVDRGLLRSAAVLAATVGWVLVINAARVLAIVLGTVELGADDWFVGGFDLSLGADGAAHQALGFLGFAAVLGLVVSTDRLLAFLVPRAEVEVGTGGAVASRAEPWTERLRPAGTPVWAAAAVGLALLAGVWFVRPPRVAISGAVATELGALRPLPEEALPAEWDGWRRVKYEAVERAGGNADLLGKFSRTWWFARGPVVAAVSVDGPFWKWHNLAYCYRNQGWDCRDVTDVRYAEAFGDAPADVPDAAGAVAADAGGGFTEMTLEDDAGNNGLVLFAAYTQEHDGIDPTAQRVDLQRRLLNLKRVWSRLTGEEVDADAEVGLTYQIQLLHTNLVEPDAETEAALRDLFHEMRRRLVAYGAEAAGEMVTDEVAAGVDG